MSNATQVGFSLGHQLHMYRPPTPQNHQVFFSNRPASPSTRTSSTCSMKLLAAHNPSPVASPQNEQQQPGRRCSRTTRPRSGRKSLDESFCAGASAPALCLLVRLPILIAHTHTAALTRASLSIPARGGREQNLKSEPDCQCRATALVYVGIAQTCGILFGSKHGGPLG